MSPLKLIKEKIQKKGSCQRLACEIQVKAFILCCSIAEAHSPVPLRHINETLIPNNCLLLLRADLGFTSVHAEKSFISKRFHATIQPGKTKIRAIQH